VRLWRWAVLAFALALTACGVALALLGSLFVLASRAIGTFEGEPISDFWSFVGLIVAIAGGIAIARVGMRLFRREDGVR
jgi:drug/metabolite transporter superfamily protein YnfA